MAIDYQKLDQREAIFPLDLPCELLQHFVSSFRPLSDIYIHFGKTDGNFTTIILIL